MCLSAISLNVLGDSGARLVHVAALDSEQDSGPGALMLAEYDPCWRTGGREIKVGLHCSRGSRNLVAAISNSEPPHHPVVTPSDERVFITMPQKDMASSYPACIYPIDKYLQAPRVMIPTTSKLAVVPGVKVWPLHDIRTRLNAALLSRYQPGVIDHAAKALNAYYHGTPAKAIPFCPTYPIWCINADLRATALFNIDYGTNLEIIIMLHLPSGC
ncbi:hypothetical protein PT974_01093 [Cladobotryum mycophilum]|uniref:Uncharacterized protein n=1 Tax=Cladobotryum mycophilum TaxID=491253 RepID=A0ABR0T2P9_9HYPO